MLPRRVVLMFALAALPAFPVAKEIVQLQRDVALLQDQIRSLQRSVDERFAVTQQLLNQNLDAAGKLSTALVVLEKTVQAQEKVLVAPVANLTSRMDTMANQFQGLRDAVDQMNDKLRRLEQQLVDIKNIVSTVPPPTAVAPAPSQPSGPPAGELFRNALKDYHAGNFDLAGRQFNEYIKLYPNTEQAADSQYYLGELLYQQEDWGRAAAAFDQVLERFPDAGRAPDAQFRKGQCLLKQGKREEAKREFQGLIKKFPNTPAASQAAEVLKGLGVSARSPQPKTPAKARRK